MTKDTEPSIISNGCIINELYCKTMFCQLVVWKFHSVLLKTYPYHFFHDLEVIFFFIITKMYTRRAIHKVLGFMEKISHLLLCGT